MNKSHKIRLFTEDYEQSQGQHHTLSKIPRRLLLVPCRKLLLQNLKKIEMEDYKDKVIQVSEHLNDGKSIRNLSKVILIKRWKQVKDIEIMCNRTSDKGIKMLMLQVEQHFQLLQHLALSFYCYTTKIGAETIGAGIGRHLSQLQNLQIILSQCDTIDDTAFNIFIVELVRHLPRMKHFKVVLYRCHKLKWDALKILVSEIARYLPQLSRLSITLSKWLRFNNDNSLHVFTPVIGKQLAQLKHLELSFQGSYLISNRGLEVLVLGLGANLNHLQSLSLHFSDCEGITNAGIETLLSVIIQNLNQLYQLDLTFLMCNKITEKMIKRLALGLGKNLLKLQSLTLRFTKLSEKSIEELREVLCSILKLDLRRDDDELR